MRKISALALIAMISAATVAPAVVQAQETRPGEEMSPANPESPAAGPQNPNQPTTTTAPAPEGSFLEKWGLLIFLGGAIVLMYVWMGRSRKKQEAKRKEMLSQLSKGDKVLTIGGIAGTVIETKGDEVVVKVDETSNVRMRFARWAIRGVGADAAKQDEQGR